MTAPIPTAAPAPTPQRPAKPTPLARRAAAGLHAGLAFARNAKALQWTPLACLALALVLMYFPWVGLYAGGRTLLGQTGFSVAFRGYGSDVTNHEGLRARLQDFFSLDPALAPNIAVPALLYFLAILLGVLAAAMFAAAGFSRSAAVRLVLPWRNTAIAGVSAAALLLLGLQLVVGFPLENQYREQVEKDTAAVRKTAQEAEGAEREARLDWVDIQRGVKEGLLRRTVWLWLTVLVNVVAVGAALLVLWRERRGRGARAAIVDGSPIKQGVRP